MDHVTIKRCHECNKKKHNIISNFFDIPLTTLFNLVKWEDQVQKRLIHLVFCLRKKKLFFIRFLKCKGVDFQSQYNNSNSRW